MDTFGEAMILAVLLVVVLGLISFVFEHEGLSRFIGIVFVMPVVAAGVAATRGSLFPKRK